MRHNLLLLGCLSAALVPISAGWAAPADAPVPGLAAPADAPASSAASLPSSTAGPPSSALSAPPPDTEAGPVKRVPVARQAPKLFRPAAQRVTALGHPDARRAKAAPQSIAYSVETPVRPVALRAKAPLVPITQKVSVPVHPVVRQASLPARPAAKPLTVPVHPAAAVPRPKAAAPAAVRTLPDYGGRDGIAGTTYAAPASSAPNPLAQAWRAFEALVIVLALIVGGLYALRRFGLIKPDGSVSGPAPFLAALPGLLKTINPAKSPVPASLPASEASAAWLTMLGSQPLPNAQGASLHLISLGGKTLLIGATAQSVSLISELDDDWQAEPALTLETGQMPSSFDGFLMQADHAPVRQSNETELLMNATTMRLQAMIARSEGQVNGHRS